MKSLFLLFFCSCAVVPTVPTTDPVTPPMHKEEEILRDIVDDTFFESNNGKSWEKQIIVGSCFDATGRINIAAPKPCPNENGVMMSEDKAAACNAAVSRIRALKADYVVDRKIWNADKKIYEGRLVEANEQIQRNYPSWFYRYGFELGLLAGVAVGIGVVKIYEVKK